MPAPSEAVGVAVSACRAADDRQAGDLILLDVTDLLALVDLFMIASARTDRHLRAVADAIEERLRDEHGIRPVRREGTAESGWYLLDFGDVICHLFSEEQREFYALERLWADVTHLDPLTGDVVSPGHAAAASAAGRGG